MLAAAASGEGGASSANTLVCVMWCVVLQVHDSGAVLWQWGGGSSGLLPLWPSLTHLHSLHITHQEVRGKRGEGGG